MTSAASALAPKVIPNGTLKNTHLVPLVLLPQSRKWTALFPRKCGKSVQKHPEKKEEQEQH